MKNNVFAYLLFFKMYHLDLMAQLQEELSSATNLTPTEQQTISYLIKSYIQFLSAQIKGTEVNEGALEYWLQGHTDDISPELYEQFLHYSALIFHNVLLAQNHPIQQELESIHHDLCQFSLNYFKEWHDKQHSMQLELQQLKKLNRFDKELIRANGSDDLPYLLTKLEQIFQYKRVLYFNYNPWLNEFSGVVGNELPKLRRLKGNIDFEPVFKLKKPLYLKEPAPFVQQIAIDLFGLSSIIFIPIRYDQQLFGWITFDNTGEEFNCPKSEMDTLTDAGIRLGMYLARKHPLNSTIYDTSLSEKDYAVLILLAEGYSNKEMANLLYLSEYTIRDYIQKFMVKFQSKNRTQIVATAFRMGLID